MAWCRYDDQFYSNPKVTAAVYEDVACLALHLLANTWTSGQRYPGYVPTHQAGVLVFDRERGAAWAGVLMRAGLWHDVADIDECKDCSLEYANLPTNASGYVFHNHAAYRAPAGARTTPGTPADLSEKRRAAGRKGGQANAKQNVAKRANAEANQANATAFPASADGASGQLGAIDNDQTLVATNSDIGATIKQTSRANQANVASKSSNCSSNAVSPVPVPVPNGSYGPSVANGRNAREDEPPNNEPPGPAEKILAEWRGSLRSPIQPAVMNQIGSAVAGALHAGVSADDVGEALRVWQQRGTLGPSVLPSLIHEISQREPSTDLVVDGRARSPSLRIIGQRDRRESTTDARVNGNLALVAELEAEEART